MLHWNDDVIKGLSCSARSLRTIVLLSRHTTCIHDSVLYVLLWYHHKMLSDFPLKFPFNDWAKICLKIHNVECEHFSPNHDVKPVQIFLTSESLSVRLCFINVFILRVLHRLRSPCIVVPGCCFFPFSHWLRFTALSTICCLSRSL